MEIKPLGLTLHYVMTEDVSLKKHYNDYTQIFLLNVPKGSKNQEVNECTVSGVPVGDPKNTPGNSH